MDKNKVYNGDCVELSKQIPNKSVDLVFCDLPYGETNNKWDTIIPFDKLWQTINRVKKDNAAVCLFAKGKFVGQLMCSNLDFYRYEIIVEKTQAKGHLNAKKMPMKAHENILVFYDKLPTYNPQKTTGHTPVHNYTKHNDNSSNYGKVIEEGISGGGNTDRYPRDVIKYAWPTYPIHPTEKPVDLCEYIIKTYSNEGDIVLDLTTGSGSIPLAAIRTNRNFYAFDSGTCEKIDYKEVSWADYANKRIEHFLDKTYFKKTAKDLVSEILKKKESSFEIDITNKHSLYVDMVNKEIYIKPFKKNKKYSLLKIDEFDKKNLTKNIKIILNKNKKLIDLDMEE